MTAGLRHVRSPYFAVLDDDDFWLPDHIKSLLALVAKCPPGRAYAFSGFLEVEETQRGEIATARERRRIANLKPPTGDIWDIMGTFAPHCWLASSELLRSLDLDDWTLRTAEDTVVQATLISEAEPIFSYRATACQVRGSEGASNYAVADTRAEDVFECLLRLHTVIDRVERKFAAPSMSNWARLNWALRRVLLAKAENLPGDTKVLALEEGVAGSSIHEREDIDQREIELRSRVQLIGDSSFIELDEEPALSIFPDRRPWAYGAALQLSEADAAFGPQWVVLEFASCESELGAGVLNEQLDGFTSRMEIPISTRPVEVWLHVAGSSAPRVIVQNWTHATPSPIILRKAWMAKETRVTITPGL
jgi:hypothetical protein